jgi:dienelactone hydrolase
MAVDGYEKFAHCESEVTRDVYRRGQGPGVVVMHELPGLTSDVVRFANWVVDAGFTVFVPCLFGNAGDEYRALHSYSAMAQACIRKEFTLLSKGQSSPITGWLRGLCRSVFEELGGPGVGAIGMCMTGNFALALMVDEHIMAPVMSQPSLPLSVSKGHREALHLSDEDLARVKRRTAAGLPVLGLRFTNDFLCPKERFATLRRELGDAFEGIEIDSSPGNSHGLRRYAHAVLTYDLVEKDSAHPTYQARDRVIEFLREQLATHRSS